MQSEVLPLLGTIDEFALHMKLWGRQSNRQYFTGLLSGFPATQAACPVVNYLRLTTSRLAYIEPGFLGFLAQITAIWLARPELLPDRHQTENRSGLATRSGRPDFPDDHRGALEGSFPTGIDPVSSMTATSIAPQRDSTLRPALSQSAGSVEEFGRTKSTEWLDLLPGNLVELGICIAMNRAMCSTETD